ncbi:MAG: DUF1593 domain-containing protein [Cytophagales bacterium]|nr:DUF1593 domain-containing protein [Cytophagales bacterium]
MKEIVFLILLVSTTLSQSFGSGEKPIVIITQDGEVDDRSSFIRFLLYTPDIDLRGIIATNSKWQKNGHGIGWINEAYGLYGQVLGNLLLHNPKFPSVEYLQSITVLGNEDPKYLTGTPPYTDSKGADLIIKELFNLDDELLHINCWGGFNTVTHALWKFRKNYPDKFKIKASQVRLITIDFQDEGGDWLVKNMPEIQIIRNDAFHMTWNYHSVDKPLPHNPYPNLMSQIWLYENVKSKHGPLGEWYPQDNISEGDTPAFLNFVDNGLRAYHDYAWGGWGGRYASASGNYWMDAQDDNNTHKTLWRWIPDLQNDFAARMDWCTKSYQEANHPPVIDEVSTPKVVKPGQKVELNAVGSDPDGDPVFYYWWHYSDASGGGQPIMINNESSSMAYFVVPEDRRADIHIILEVKDNGSPSLKRYSRLIYKVQN